tara:strand:- start:489 stop:1166 length:678 start_codon:yes stop_codon:yes gene_type:complete
MELTLKFSAAPAVLFLETQLPIRAVKDLNKYLDERHNKGAESFAGKLVGQISHGEQLKIDHTDPLVDPFTKIVANMSQSYLGQFSRMIGVEPLKRIPHVHSLWSVHSYERDYNPVHDHGTDTIMGLSFTTWTKIPKQILDKDDYDSSKLVEASGIADGFLQFHFGQTSSRGLEELRPPFSRMVKPEVGKLIMFPSWCQHCVYPFEGKGERRTVAGNLNMFPTDAV